MSSLPRKIRYKIVVPFTLLMVAATVITAVISVRLISAYLEARFMAQIADASAMVAQTDFALNDAVLANFSQILDAEILSYGDGGEVLAGTVPAGERDELLRLVRQAAGTEPAAGPGDPPQVRDVEFRGERYKVAYRALRARDDAVVAFIVSTAATEQAQAMVARNIAFVTVVLIVALAAIGHFVARSITSPIQQLVDHTRKLSAGRLDEVASVNSGDEIAELANAINEMTERLRASEQKLVQSEKLALTGQLAARVAHDVRNPLSSIKMQAQLLRKRVDDDDGRESLRAMLRDIDRVEWVVQGLLDLARPGNLDLDGGDINAVVREALALTAAQLKHRKIAVKESFAQELPPVLMDAPRLKQALLNVIVNAAEAMPNYGGTLEARTARGGDGATVRVEISDEGVGIDEHDAEHLFDPFFTTKREGVGLGLVNTKSVVERHGGNIALTARSGGGTTAVITLPAAAPTVLPINESEAHGTRPGR